MRTSVAHKLIRWIARVAILRKLLALFSRLVPSDGTAERIWRKLASISPSSYLVAWWSGLSAFSRRLAISLLIGLGISLLLHLFHEARWIQDANDLAVDWVMKLERGTGPARGATPFVILDIDERTYRAWGEPFHVPRDRLLRLVDYAVRARAALIVVNVDLSRRGQDPAADSALEGYLAAYGSSGEPPLILTRAFRKPLLEGARYPEEQRSFLEEGWEWSDSPLIQWGSTLFALDDDCMLRRWYLWHPVCSAGTPAELPSVQLLTVAAIRPPEGSTASGSASVTELLERVTPPNCSGDGLDGSTPAHIDVAGMRLSTEPHGVAQRIIFRFPWELERGERYPDIPQKSGATIPALSIRSALPIASGDPRVLPGDLQGRIVVIGGSFEAGRDWYVTPLGKMPGALVLVNAINSLQQYGEISRPPWYAQLMIEAVLIFAMAVLFSVFNSFWGMVASGLVIILLLLPLTFVFFKQGLWLDFAVPLIAVQLHQMAAEWEEMRHNQGRRHDNSPLDNQK